MDNTIGRWYLNGTTLEYREFKKNSTGSYTEELSTTALVKISGLSTNQVVNGTGNDAGFVLVNANDSWRKLNDGNNKDIEFEDTTTDGKTTGTITIASLVLPKQANKSISITGSTNYEYTLKLAATDQVRLKGTDTVSHGTNGTTTITGNLTAGYTIATNGKSATYYAERTNQKLATITGLAKSYTESTLKLNDVAYEENTVGGTGEITLSKTSTASEVSALGTSAITLSMDNVATANGISYHLKLGEASGKTYKQVAANDEKAYWTVKGTTATYQYYSPTGYELTNAKNEVIATDGTLYKSDGVTEYASGDGDRVATKVKVTAAKTTTVVTVTGLASDLTTNITDNNQYPKAVGTGQSRDSVKNFVSGITITKDVDTDGTGSKPTYKADGKTLGTDADGNVTGKGTAKIKISKAALPTSGTVTITPGKEFTVTAEPDDDFYQKSGDIVPTDVQKQRIWVINGTTATYKEVDLAYYTVGEPDDKGVQKIVCTTQTSGTVLATVKNLNEDWLANEANLTRIENDTNGGITAIKGIDIETDENGYNYTNDKPVAKTENPGTITLSSEVLDGKNVTIANSDNYRLALATSDGTGITKVTLPGFSNYKWNLSGTTATLKGDVTAGYTAADNGKTITYTAAATNQTLATVNGLKKGTELERDTTGDAKETDSNYRKIGNYIGDSSVSTNFFAGLNIVTTSTDEGGYLSHNESGTLVRMPITISKHVMDTSKISLNSNFFTLKLDDTNQGYTVGTSLADKAASRTYVLTKDKVYTKDTDDKGKTTYTPKTNAGAIIGWHGTLGSTAKLQTSVPACYELATDGKSITYTKPANGVLLATVKGLNSAVTENDIEVGINPDTDGKYTITIKNSNALTTGNVTITNATTDENKQYKLALETNGIGDTAISGFDTVLTDKSWSQSGTTINYTAKVNGPGYKLSSDASQITYLKENTSSTPTTLATITGLRKEILTSASENAPTGITLDADNGTITLSNTVLNNANVELKGNANYTLKIDNTVVSEKPKEIERWVISGTTATYKAVTPDYYTLNGNKLTYTAVKDAVYQGTDSSNTVTYADKDAEENKNKYNANGTGKTIPALGAIKGLKSGLAVDSTGQKIGYYNGSGNFVEAIAFDTDDTNMLVIRDAGVLDYKSNVELDKAALETGYKIKLADSLNFKPTLATDSTATWTISNGTATYKGNVAAGYANNADNTKIIFSKAQNNAEIAKITGLKKGITDASSIKENSGVITIKSDVLGETDAKLETKIALTGSDYKLTLDSNVKQSVADSDKKNIWSVSGTTATYGTWTPTYYTLEDNDDDDDTTLNNVIKYHGEGVSDDNKLATITGLVSGLVTIPDTAQDNLDNAVIRGITVYSNTITLDSNVLSESPKIGDVVKLTNHSDTKYELAVTSNVDTPQNTVAYTITNGTNTAEVKINQEKTAGFTLNNAATTKIGEEDVNTPTLTYTEATSIGDGNIANLTGLKKGITLNDEGGIDGITIAGIDSQTDSDKIITLSTDVLTNSNVKNSDTTSKYTLALADGTPAPSQGWGWVATGTKGSYELRSGMATYGYSIVEETADSSTVKYIKYTGGDQDGNTVATVSGLDNATLTGTALSGITLDGSGNITIGEAALSKKDIVITAAEGKTAPTIGLAAGINESKTTKTWSVNNGTATHTQTITEGYALDSTNNTIKYTPSATITSTLTGLSKENLTAGTTFDANGDNKLLLKNENGAASSDEVITFADGKFTVKKEDALAHKKATLTVKTSNNLKAADYPYVFALDDAVAAKVDDPVWNKAANDTKATYTQTTASGYSLDSKETTINYSTDPTTVTLATVSNLAKEVVLDSTGKITADATGTLSTAVAGLAIKTKTVDSETVNDTDNDGNTIITISKGVLSTNKVSLGGSDKYVFELDATKDGQEKPTDTAVPAAATDAQVWTVSGTTATYKNVQTPYYKFETKTTNGVTTENKKNIEYVKQADGMVGYATIINRTVIKGLKSGLKPDDNGVITGITVDNEESEVTLSSAVLGTSTVTSDTYTLALNSDVVSKSENYKDKIEWVGDGTTYTYKKYNKPHYTLTKTGEKASKEITYTKAADVETYAKITGLAKNLVDNSATATESSTSTAIGFSGDSTNGGTITLGKKQLEGVTSTVKLDTTGNYKLALDTTSDNNATTKAEISNRKWATSGTTATLTATKGVGYTLSEDEKSITYQKAAGTVTLAKITGLKKGATITEDLDDSSNSDVALDSTTGNYVITLKQAQLGTTDVKVTGDGYTLKIAEDALSGSTDPDWVKADNQTKATFTQTRYNGFRESTDGKSLIYQKATGTVDLATINGLSKTLKKDQMAIVASDTAAATELAKNNILVVLNTDTKVITLKQAALSGKVTLGKNDDYTLKLHGGVTSGKIGGDKVAKKVTYNNGTMSIVSGTTESWEESTDGKTLNYTAAKYDTLATVSNLPKNLTYTDSGSTASISGVTVNGNEIAIGKGAVAGLSNNAKITLSNKTVNGTASTYKLVNATGADSLSALPSAPDKKKWVLSGTTLDLKAVTSEGFSVSDTVIAYTAEKVGSSLAKITFKGLTKDFITQKSDGKAIYVGGDSLKAAVTNTLNDMNSKEITLDANLLDSIKGAGLATTIELTGSNGYTFATTNFTGEGAQSPPNTEYIKFNEDSFKTAGKATLKIPTSAGWTFDSTNKNKAVYSKATSADGGTVNGIKKDLTYSQVNANGSTTLKLGDKDTADSLNITVGAGALTTTDVTFTTVRGGNSYKFVLGSGVNSTANDSTKGTWKNQIEWVSSNGTATYKFYDKENYYVNDKNVIKYVKPTNGTTFAQISGMSKTASISPTATGVISLGANDLGTSKVTLKITTAKEVNATVAEATTINASITAGNTTASGFKLALKGDVLLSKDTQAVWDTNNTTANLTGTTTKGYKLSNDQMSITYQSAPTKLKVIAKVTGIKSGSKITDDNVSTNDTNPNLTIKEITLHNSNLGTSNVQLTGEGYKLKLDSETTDSVIGANGDADSIFWQDQTEWVANNGTFTYKTYDKAHYTLDSTGMKVTYTAAKDNNKDENHKTFAQITGLAKTAEASDFDALTSLSGGSIVTANDGVISLRADVLNKVGIKLTDKEIGGYSLVFGSDAASLQSTVDDKSVNAVISGTGANIKSTWTGTQGKGYFLANDGQSVTYYSSAKKKQTIATVTGLASTVTSANNDAFSDKYGGSSNVVSLSAADLSDKVTVGGTAAFEFASGVESISAVGSSSADKLTFASGNNTINAGSGNDFVTLAGGSNTFLYANGNGNDVIKGFNAESDIIKVTNVVGTTTTSTTKNGTTTTTSKNNIEVYQDTKIAADTLVKVNNNYIRLKGVTASNVKVYDKDGDIWDSTQVTNNLTGSFKPVTTPGNVLADDNYAMTPQNVANDEDYAMSPNLSSIVKSSTASYTADDLVADDATALTKQSTAVSYSGKK